MAGARSIPYTLDESEVEFEAVRAQGSGGQNVNKVSNAAHLRFDLRRASLPDALRERLLARADRRIGADGVVRIKAQEHRSLERNRRAALARLRVSPCARRARGATGSWARCARIRACSPAFPAARAPLAR